MLIAFNPSPCPSPPGRGDALTAGAAGLPLPGGEGWGEGRFAPFKAPLLHRDGAANPNSRPHIFNCEK